MKNKKIWIDLSLISLVTLALLGLIMRSKILFSLPLIDYNRLLDAHSHFAFGGWVTLALMVLMVYELLPDSQMRRPIYQWLFGAILLSSWGMLLSFFFSGNCFFSNFLSAFFIFTTYLFGYFFIKDILKSGVRKTVQLLSILSLVSLIISSICPFVIAYLFASKSLDAILYRDALFTYLHLQYNGFFTLAVFALLFHRFELKITEASEQNIHRFSVLLSASIVPSLFLSYLWHDPHILFRVIAIAGSILLLLSLTWFIIAGMPLLKFHKEAAPTIRFIGLLSMTAFMLKMFLQSFTIFPSVGDGVFGDRPMIIGFLHLVFLGFVTLFLLAYFAQLGLLNIKNKFTRVALILFSVGVLFNEIVLMGQGLGVLFIKSSHAFPWLLWTISIWLFIGAFLICISRIKYRSISSIQEK